MSLSDSAKEKLSGKTALVVDDEELIREIIEMELEDYGVSVSCAENGKEAGDYIKDHDVDFIITDVRMPGATGVDLLKVVLEHKKPVPKIFIISGYKDYTDQQLKDMGADGVIGKPFEIDDVLEEIADVL